MSIESFILSFKSSNLLNMKCFGFWSISNISCSKQRSRLCKERKFNNCQWRNSGDSNN